VKNIEVGKEAVTVNYHLPMPPAKSDKDVMGVLPFIMNGRLCRSRTCGSLLGRKVILLSFGQYYFISAVIVVLRHFVSVVLVCGIIVVRIYQRNRHDNDNIGLLATGY